jgi:hypothetical protein
MTRLFTFGCSFTYYKWPTWADILSKNYAYYENWAACGVGNQFIFNSVIEALIRRKINQHDTVMIMWSNFSRWDRYQNGRWQTTLFSRNTNHSQWKSNDQLLNMMLDIRGSYIRDLALIYATHNLLDQIGCQHYIFSMVDINNIAFGLYDTVDSEVSDLLQAYEPSLSKIKPSVHRTVFDLDWHSRPIFSQTPRKDIHPSPREHLLYLDSVVPEITISDHVRDWVIHADDLVQKHPEIDEPIDAEINHYGIPDWKTKRIERW